MDTLTKGFVNEMVVLATDKVNDVSFIPTVILICFAISATASGLRLHVIE